MTTFIILPSIFIDEMDQKWLDMKELKTKLTLWCLLIYTYDSELLCYFSNWSVSSIFRIDTGTEEF